MDNKSAMEERPPPYSEIQEEQFTKQDFVDLLKHFYKKDWMTGTGGAMAIRIGEELWISPSGVQKERVKCTDIFVYQFETLELMHRPENRSIKVSACSQLFFEIMSKTPCRCVIHTHSMNSNLVTLNRTTTFTQMDIWKVTEQEYLKGIYNLETRRNYSFDDKLKVMIVPNAPTEDQLLPSLRMVLNESPSSTAMLVRNHGVFVWGLTWEQTKIQLECYDYLFGLSIETRKLPISGRAR